MDTVAQTTAANPLVGLAAHGQSPWLDFIRRSFLHEGKLKHLVEADGLKGVTSNPSIFEKAMGEGTDYDEQFKQVLGDGAADAGTIYETLAVDDIREAAGILRPVFDATGGVDGYVSLEVSPYLGLDTDGSIEEARRLWKWVDRPNLMVKVPGTEPGVPAIRTLIADGLNINVTLLFSLDSYKAVAEAYIAGLEARAARGDDVSHIASVASFFVSRIDAQIDGAIDKRLAANDPEAAALKAVRGKVAIANAKMAYQHYLSLIGSPRWQALADKGAKPQRLLWASTGTKDKAYSDVLYVDGLIGRDTVNTLPPATMEAFRDHGRIADTLVQDLDGARHVLSEAERLGLDLPGVTKRLVEDGVRQFSEAFDALLGAVAAKRATFLGDKLTKTEEFLPEALVKTVAARRDEWRRDGNIRRLWAHDASLWTNGPEANWLAWLDIVEERKAGLAALEAFQREVREAGFTDVLLLGMGGSSLGPEVLGSVFGPQKGFPKLHVLDSTDPQQVSTFERRCELARTLVIVSSKSGGTLEPNILKAYFFDRMKAAVGDDTAGSHFVAVTDPGSHMQTVAEADRFRHIFYGDKAIGGRYSVLSNFGLVPAAAAGLDVRGLLDSAERMVRACASSTPPSANPGVALGTILGEAARAGRDKVTIIASPAIADLGAWLEQLIAESTGKIGKGMIPIDGETPGKPEVYGSDRVFAYLRLEGDGDATVEGAIDKLREAGHPVVRITLADRLQITQEFFRWEIATAVAGSIIGIDPFDQPDVEASKIETKKLTDAYNKSGTLPDEEAFASDGPFAFFADEANAKALGSGSLIDVLRAQFRRAGPGDYVGLLAYVERDENHIAKLQQMRLAIRDRLHVATCAEFGPRFLHSTGQAYKGGPASGVFIQITAEDAVALEVPGERYSFGVVKAAQARGDFDVLAERGRRALRVHISGDLEAGLARFGEAVEAALG